MTRFRKYILKISIFVVVAALAYGVIASTEVEDNPTSVTILASSSLTDVMTELTRIYVTKSGHSVGVAFAAPAQLLDLIEEGEPADFIISEDQDGMVNLKRKGLIDVFTLSNIAQNRLVLAASVDHYLSRYVRQDMALSRLFSDINERVLLVMGDPDEVPVGMRAKEAIDSLGYWQSIMPYIVRTENARRARYLIAKGRNVGVTYYTDAFGNPEIKILSEFPQDSYSPIIYQAAVVAGLNMPYARKFMDFLKSPQAKVVFHKYGFDVN